jgi:predicted permease
MGILTLTVGGASGLIIGRALRLAKPQAGAYFASSAFFNIGSIGALIVFIFLGESGFALVPFFRLFEEFTYYAFGFPIAKSFSPELQKTERPSRRVAKILVDPFILVAVGSIALGFGLNLSGLPRPDVFSQINTFVIPVASLLLLISIGMAMRFGKVGRYLREAFLVAATKFIIVPVSVVLAAAALGLGRIENGLPLQVIVILSSMPVGFIALVPPALYKLDVDLANSAWLVTTAFLIVVIPLQMLLTRLLA